MVSEWIIEGEPSIDLWPFDIRRFNNHHNEKSFLYPRTIESYGKTYFIHFPGEEHESSRNIRQSPLYDLLKEKGASYGSKAGWERPNFFVSLQKNWVVPSLPSNHRKLLSLSADHKEDSAGCFGNSHVPLQENG